MFFKTVLFHSFVLMIILLLFSCSVRDYTNPILNKFYSSPVLTIASPAADSTNTGNVTVSGSANAYAGVNKILVHYQNGDVVLEDSQAPTNFSFTANLYFNAGSNQTITVTAYDKNNHSASASVPVYINGPVIQISTAYLVTLSYTNASTILVNGQASYPGGNISNVVVTVAGGTQTSNYSTVVSFGNWSKTVMLYSNMVNTITAAVIGDTGIRSTDTRTIVVDNTPPAPVNFIYPLPGESDMPAEFNLHTGASDSLSGVRTFFYQLDNGIFVTNFIPNNKGKTNTVDLVYTPMAAPLTNGPHRFVVYALDHAGNSAPHQTNDFMVDQRNPTVRINKPVYGSYTNVNTINLDGTAYVGNGNTITSLLVNMNNTSFIPVSSFDSNTSNWINSNTALLANQTNSFTVMALTAMNRTNWGTGMVINDITPPLATIMPTNHSVFVNTNRFVYSVNSSDNLSGITRIISRFQRVVGNFLITTTYTNDYSSLLYVYSSAVFDDGTNDLGYIVTNTTYIYDQAGNVYTETNTISVYPAVFVSTNGVNSNPGFATSPVGDIQLALDMAQNLGISNVLVSSGVYNDSGSANQMVLLKDGINLYGGYPLNWNIAVPDPILNPTVLNGQGHNTWGILADKVSNLLVYGLSVENFGNTSTTNGGGLLALNSRINLLKMNFLSNQSLLGSGITAVLSDITNLSNSFSQNTADAASPVFCSASKFFMQDSLVVSNICQPSAAFSTVLYFTNSIAVLVNNTISSNTIADSKLMSAVSVLDSLLIMTNNSLYRNAGNMNSYGVLLEGVNTSALLFNNLIGVTNNPGIFQSYGVYEASAVNSRKLANNQFYGGELNVLYHTGTALDLTNIADVNDPSKTGASADSTNNILLP